MRYEDDETPRAARAARAARAKDILNRLERVYLAAIRAIALVAATLLVIFAIWLAISGLYKSSRDVSSVQEQPAVVSPEEVTAIDLEKLEKPKAAINADPLAAEKRFYAGFAQRYYGLFKNSFEPYKKPEDQPLDPKAFDQRYLHTGERLDAIKEGASGFEQDKADLESLLTTMTAAASNQKTVDRLKAYKAARKTPVTRTESGTRQETYCSYYGFYIDECISYGTRTVPYSRKIQELKLPAGIVSHTDLFGAYQDAYLSKLAEKREANAAAAQRQRNEIMTDNADGQVRLWSALQVVGVFLVLMFLFLLIALERHQRKIAASLPAAE
jgi:hypothetical protein